MRILILTTILGLVSCGEGGGAGNNTNTTTGIASDAASVSKSASVSYAVAQAADLPTCDASHNAQLAYVVAEKKFKYCESTSWVEISEKQQSLIKIADAATDKCATGGKAIKAGVDDNASGALDEGEVDSIDYVCNGIAGGNGKDGINGTNGTNGTDNHATASFLCQATLTQATATASGISAPAGGLVFAYSAVKMASGDVFAEASIANASYQTSQSNYYAAKQNGSLNAAVVITDDWYSTASYGWWSISLDRSTLIPTAVFNDSSMPTSSTRTFTFPASSCTVQTY